MQCTQCITTTSNIISHYKCVCCPHNNLRLPVCPSVPRLIVQGKFFEFWTWYTEDRLRRRSLSPGHQGAVEGELGVKGADSAARKGDAPTREWAPNLAVSLPFRAVGENWDTSAFASADSADQVRSSSFRSANVSLPFGAFGISSVIPHADCEKLLTIPLRDYSNHLALRFRLRRI